jgi:hypothetical protein
MIWSLKETLDREEIRRRSNTLTKMFPTTGICLRKRV